MIQNILTKLIGSKNERELRRLQPVLEQVNSLEPEISKLSDSQLQAKTNEFRQRLAQGETIEDLLAEAFATVRESARRVINMRHFDMQIIGGVVLHEGKIAEMATGEGKTLVATLPAYLNALEGKGVHIVTVNDYLAHRDRDWMGGVYEFLGLKVGVIQHELNDLQRKEAYQADITYGTNNEFGFDYLRDNMKFDLSHYVQRGHHYAIVDEVDSILIDEARTPLIISGPTDESTDKYYIIDRIIPRLKKAQDYEVEEKTRTVALSEEGIAKSEKFLNIENLYDPQNMEILHHINQALKAHVLFKRDVDYVVKNGEVIIVDEFTGRMMSGRRYSEGLHQALEAKEKVKIENENQTLATITFQNYFRLYEKLAGMTGTADTEAQEFAKIYNLDVMVIPTNRPLIRHNNPDVVYRTEGEKFQAAVKEIEELYQQGRPVLVGTISIEKSETLSTLLKRKGIKHHVLNAKHHEKEAQIVAEAGQKSAITIATNMAGRGTDIVLGEGIAKIGGLHILGTERHESRRIDNQLRGRAGRQGDPGSSRFYLSLEDDLLRIFGSERLSGIMQRIGLEEGQPIEHGLITKAIENAQKKVESHHFDIRKHLLEYDDVMNRQREIIYEQRRMVLSGQDLEAEIFGFMEDLFDNLMDNYCPAKAHPEDWDLAGLQKGLIDQFRTSIPVKELELQQPTREEFREQSFQAIQKVYQYKKKQFGEELFAIHQRLMFLQVIDSLWKDHLLAMDHLKEGIGLRGYGQKDPLTEYKREGFTMFEDMFYRIQQDSVRFIFMMQPPSEEYQKPQERQLVMHRGNGEAQGSGKNKTIRRENKKVGRNEPCPCGSGKKFKKCCGSK